jgi:hypothetical protein
MKFDVFDSLAEFSDNEKEIEISGQELITFIEK